jgi:hypothetical protein
MSTNQSTQCDWIASPDSFEERIELVDWDTLDRDLELPAFAI